MKFKSSVRKIISLLVAVIMISSIAIPKPVMADENTPQSLHELFNSNFYAAKYPEVVNVLGNDPEALYKHFIEYGLNEGRTCSAALNVKMYRDNYADVNEAFGNDWDKVVQHYFNNGIGENRLSFVSQSDLDIQNRLDGVLPASAENSSILGRIDNAVAAANASDSGYALDAAGIIADKAGHALVPWQLIQEEGRIQDIDELIARCGNDLILVRDENNQIKFVGGRFSSVKVTDETTAVKALDTMANFYGNVEERAYLKLNDTGVDSMGNPFYRFVPVDKEGGYTHDKVTITLSADKEGNVLGASNSYASNMYSSGDFQELSAAWGKDLQSVLEDPQYGYTKLFDEPRVVYDPLTKNYYWAMYYEKNGIVNEYLVDTVDGEYLYATRYYDAETFRSTPEQSFNRDYEFKNLNSAQELTFIDYYNNPVTLPVAYEEGKGWYIVDPERHMICVQSSKDDKVDNSKLYEKHYFSNEYFEAVNAYINGAQTSDLLENEKVIIQSFTTLQTSFDEYKNMGMLQNPSTIYVDYKYDDTTDNASQTTHGNMIVFTVNNNRGNADFAGISHEFGHAVVANQGQNIPYQAATGAINESYADILGNLMKMIKKQEGVYAGNVDYQRWLIGEFLGNDTEHVIRDMSNPYNNGRGGTGSAPAPIQVNDQYFAQDEGQYNSDNDYGGVHANNSILSNICYRMYNEVIADKGEDGLGKPDMNKYRDLLQIWYDSVIYVNRDTTYSDIKGYVLQSMKNHGYSSEQINQAGNIFNEANVDEYKPFGSEKSSSEIYNENEMAAAAKVGNMSSGQNELYNYMKSANDSQAADYDLGIAIDEYKIAQIKGLTGDELKPYEDQITIARNAAELKKNAAEAQYNSFADSQARVKEILDDKVDKLAKQGEVIKQVTKEKESNPNLERAYRALRRSAKTNYDEVSQMKASIDEAMHEFSGEENIMGVYESVWNFDASSLTKDDLNVDDDNASGNQDSNFECDDFWDAYFGDLFDTLFADLDIEGVDFSDMHFDDLDAIDWSGLLDDEFWDDILSDDFWNDDSSNGDASDGDSADDDWGDLSGEDWDAIWGLVDSIIDLF